MPGQARIEAPGALHHIICRMGWGKGTERRKIFWNDADCDSFVNRLGISQPTASQPAKRGEKIVKEKLLKA